MIKSIVTVILLLSAQCCFSQKIYFAKANYSDSIALDKNITLLAQQAILLYHEADKATYFDNLFRLQLVAARYADVAASLKQLAFITAGDSVSPTGLGFPFQVYNATLATMPADGNMELTYKNVFEKKYTPLTADGKNWAAEYFGNDLVQLKTNMSKKLQDLNSIDSITVTDAVKLCRTYCSYKTLSRTQPIAKEMLAKFEKEKYIQNDSVLVTMPDGGIIALTVVRDRKIATPQPVVLMYNIYAGQDASHCKNAVARGYVGVEANTRGKRLSPNKIEPYEHDAADAYYIIDWISKQPWCNGKVGMYGGSYLGFSQWSAVKRLHPALKTIVPQVAVAPGIDFPNHHGVFMNFTLRWLHYVMNNKLTDNAAFGDTKKWDGLFEKWYKNGSSFRSLDTLEGKPNAIFQRMLQHPGYDNYWQKMTPQQQEFSKIDIPIFTTTGYWDDDQTGAMYYYHQYQKWNRHNNYYLLIGPYDHGGSQGYPKPSLSGYTIDSVAKIPILEIVFEWFNYVLKDSSRPAILKDKINFEVMGGNRWLHVPSLEKMSNDTLRFYLGNTSIGGQYPLLGSKPAATAFINQVVDLKDRSEVRFVSEEVSMFPKLIDSVLVPQKEQLVFMSDPIDKAFAISGAATASIMANINKKDMDVFFNLYELTTDAKYIALTSNLQRASYAKDNTKRQLLTPYKIETININHTYITCRQLQKGSRIVVVMGVNKNPNWQINYGTGKDVSDETMADAAIPMQIKWYNNSCIKIPVLR